MTRDNNKKTHYVVLGGKGGGQAESVDWSDIQNKPEFATVATSGDYDDLNDKPTILTQWFGTQAEYDAIATKDPNVIYNIEGSDNVQADWNQTDTTADDYIKNKPTIPAAQVNADWNADSGVAQILNKPTLATVATTGDYDDLTNKPTIPAAQVNSDWNATSGVAQILNKPTLATVATTGSYNDLTDKPTVTQEQADWNQTDTTAVDYIKNKPEIPSVPAMATQELTFTLQGGTTKTIEFYTVPNYFYVEDISGSNNTLSISKSNASAPDVEVFYSTDKINWTSMGTTSTTAITATIPANGKLYLKANANQWGISSYYNTINCNNNFNVGGNIMSLIYSDNFIGKTVFPTNNGNVFHSLFSNSLIVSAGNLLLPATAVPNDGYSFMFQNCTSLTTAPAVLPASSVGTYGYNRMFQGCTSLTTAPEIYCNTFGPNACLAMFANCTNLNKIVTYNKKLGIQSHQDWLYKVAATGDFYNLGGAKYSSGTSGIPSGWTEHTSL